MRKLVLMATLALAAGGAQANVIERACLNSDRQAANRSLCGCIQNVADKTLSRGEQRKGAKFFKDPQKAQDTRQSNNSGNEAFWGRWKNFGDTAEAYCQG